MSLSTGYAVFFFKKIQNAFDLPLCFEHWVDFLTDWEALCTAIGEKGKGHFNLLKEPFPFSRFGHFQCPKRKFKTTSEYKHTPN